MKKKKTESGSKTGEKMEKTNTLGQIDRTISRDLGHPDKVTEGMDCFSPRPPQGKIVELTIKELRRAKMPLEYIRWFKLQETTDMEVLLKRMEEQELNDIASWTMGMIAHTDERMKACLKYFDIDMQSKYGVTPLHWAVWFNNTDTAQILMDNGADINVWNKWEASPLDRAIKYNQTDMIKILRKEKIK